MSKKVSKLELLQKLVLLLSKSAGRDQTCRLTQYACTLFGNKVSDKLLAQKILAVGSQMSGTRKVLRFGKPIGLYITMINNIKTYLASRQSYDQFNKGHNLLFLVAALLSNCCSMIFFLSDHILWLCNVLFTYDSQIGVMKNPELKQRMDFWNDFIWIWESVFDIVCAITEMVLLHKKILWLNLMRPENFNAEITRINERINTLIKDIVRTSLNIPMAMGFVYGTISRPKIGALGIVTSLIGINQIWV